MNIKSLSVSKLNNYIKNIFNNDAILNNISVEGEISNFKNHTSGHLYFSLKDKDSRILCVMFKGNVASLNFIPVDGKEVEIKGYVTLYEKSGQYQLYVQQMKIKGDGSLYLQFEELKRKLHDQGWFDESIKIPIPIYPKRVAIITSKTGAALRDIVSVIKRRNPSVEIYLFPVLVQGLNAKYEIANAIERINDSNYGDVIILGRGGGSIEELWAFNELLVAESIFNSHIPIISAVGHETDFTIADFVADVRAATPSAAAELAVASLFEIKSKLDNYKILASKEILTKIQLNKNILANFKNHYQIKRPIDKLNQHRQQLDLYENRIYSLLKSEVHARRIALLNIKTKLNELNLLVHKQKSMIQDINGKDLDSIRQLNLNDELIINFKDGSVRSKIIEIKEVYP
ncbi:exodeoxyribonuclease VII large subunit [Alkalibaculum sp. M08DMB]|uniref:Exodeoxyribonuclease 7 large subunit n=1 Tax=Alkalibaculum sporogenes TaxID=2655001 RepID=A0A6A7K747_9FIRM|nr:exodeoxyribonuclease VII large subunit [Alkalibaculum sporogenes]MPW25161.1 exodeoxyribonuclease VII large subunit [Alkalibaculum sporogenes]